MRFLMFDRITEYQKNKQICGVKQITRESGVLEQVNGGFVYPGALAVESLAQIGGWLISASLDFQAFVLLAMIVKARIFAPIFGGDELTLRVNVCPGGWDGGSAVTGGEIWRGAECVLQIEKIVYGVFPTKEEQLIREQKRLFAALFRE